MSGYGDTEPEDAWDAGDPTPILIGNLFRRLALLEPPLRFDPSGINATDLDTLAFRLAPFVTNRALLSEREQVRVDQLADDIATLRARND